MISSLLPLEEQLVLRCIDERATGEELGALAGAPGLDWGRVAWLGEREKAAAPLWRVLRALPEGTIPEDRAAAFSAIARVWEFRMLRLQGLLGEILRTLAGEGVDVVLLKGAALGASVYGSFADRPMSDLDLLVPRRDVRRGWDALRASGWLGDDRAFPPEFYETHHHVPPLTDSLALGVSVELHTATGDGTVDVPAEAIRRAARPIRVGALDTRVPSPEHLVLHLATHFVWGHEMRSGGWRTFRDLERILARSDLDWDLLVRAAREVKAATCCYWTFRLAGGLAGVRVPSEVLTALSPPRSRPVLRLLERHFVMNLFEGSPTRCPSEQVSKFAWTRGVAPRWSGHGDARPWKRGEAWGALGGPAAPDDPDRRPRRVDEAWTRTQGWMGYLRRLLRPRTGFHPE